MTLLGVLWTPLLSPSLGFLPDRGYALAKIFALLIITYIAWILNFIFPHIGFFSPSLLSFLLSCHLLFLFWRLGKKTYPKLSLKRIFYSEIIFFCFFCFCLISFGFHSELYGGEKPMDINLLSYAIRFEGGPFEDPWFAGTQLHYYYWGYLLFSTIAKISGVSAHLAYPLALATSMGWFASILFSLFCFITRKIKISCFLTFILMMSTNAKAVALLIERFFQLSFEDFWKVSRVFKGQEFAEFPLWSYLFADLHPHVMSYPIAASVLLLTLYIIKIYFKGEAQYKVRQQLRFSLISALFFGALLGINTWDFLFFTLFNSLLFIFYGHKGGFLKSFKERLSYGPHFFLLHLLGFLLFCPILFQLGSHVETKFFYHGGEREHLAAFLWLLGQWVLLFFIGQGWKKKELLCLFGVAVVMAIFFEFFVFMDRVNTLFKGLTTLWWIFGVISLGSLGTLANRSRRLGYGLSLLLAIPAFSLLYAVISFRPFGPLGFSLKGDHYLMKADPGLLKVTRWMNTNIRGTPRLLERYGRSFEYTASRVSSHTGLPSFLGWDHHVALRGKRWINVAQRKLFIDRIYESNDPLLVASLLKEEGIKYIVIGRNERKNYNSAGLDKFKYYKDLFGPLVKFGDTALYELKN